MSGQANPRMFGSRSRRGKRDWSDELEYPDPSVVLGMAIVDGIAAGCAVLQQLSEDVPVPDSEEIERVGLGSPLDRLRTFLILQEALKDPRVQALGQQRGSLPPSLKDGGRFSRMKEIFLGKLVDSAVKNQLESAAAGESQKHGAIIPGHVFSVPKKSTFLPFDPWQGVVREPVRSDDGGEDLSAE